MCNGKGCCKGVCIASMVARILVIVGGLNWGLFGIGMLMGKDWNVIHMIFGTMPTIEAIIYILVGLAAVVGIFGCRCKKCMEACTSCNVESMDKKM